MHVHLADVGGVFIDASTVAETTPAVRTIALEEYVAVRSAKGD
jgi:hypothetical protein